MLGRGLSSLIPIKNKKTSDDSQKELSSSETKIDVQKNLETAAEEIKNPSVLTEKVKEMFFRPSSVETEMPPEKFAAEKSRPNRPRSSEAIFQIEVEKIKPNPFQPRKDFDEVGLQDLAQSIREFGILQPLVVSKIIKETEAGRDVEYQLIAGERRLMAAKLIGLERVPAIIKQIDNQRDKLEMALIENLQRSNLNPLEAAKAYSRLQDEFGLTQREIASRVGKSREVIANTLRLLNLPLEIQIALKENKISESQARALLSISNLENQKKLFQEFLNQKISVRVRRGKPNLAIDPQHQYWQEQLEEKLGLPVKLIRQGSKGKIVIHFYSDDEWQAILNHLLGKQESSP